MSRAYGVPHREQKFIEVLAGKVTLGRWREYKKGDIV
jgi:hypothetical protein